MRSIVLAALIAGASSAFAAPPAWMNALDGAAHPAGIVLAGGSPVVAYTSSPCGANLHDNAFRNRMAVAKFDAAGKQLYDVEIPRPKEVIARLRGPSFGVIDGIAALPDGDLIVVAEFIEGQPWLLRLDSATGGVRFSKPIGDPKGHTVISSISSAGDDVVIGGGVENHIYVARYSGNGEKRWEQTVNAGGTAVANDVAAMSDGSAVAAATAGSQVVIIRFDKSGQSAAQRRFEGEAPQLAVTRDTIGVAYDIPNTRGASLRFKALDASLTELTEVAFESPTTAKQIVAGNGAFRLYYAAAETIRVASFSARGTREADAVALEAKFGVELQVAAASDAAYIALVDPFFSSNGTICPRARLARISPTSTTAKGIQ